MIFKYGNMNTTKGREEQKMFYSTDCNYVIKVIEKDCVIECYTKEQVKNNIKHSTGCIVYKVLDNGTLERMAIIKPYKN